MAADSSVSHIMFFIAAVIVAGSLAGVFIGIAGSMGQTIQDREDALADQLESDITIINDPTMVPYSDSTLTLYLKNTGTSTLSRNGMTVLVDGLFFNYTVASASSNPSWLPEKVIQVEVQVVLLPGDHTAKVITANGASDQLQFRI